MKGQAKRHLNWVGVIVALILVIPTVLALLVYGLIQRYPAVAECRKINAALQDVLDSQPQFQDYEFAPCYESLWTFEHTKASLQASLAADQSVVEALESSRPLLEKVEDMREKGIVDTTIPVAMTVQWLYHGTPYKLNLGGRDPQECTNFTHKAQAFAGLDGVKSVTLNCGRTSVDWGVRKYFPPQKFTTNAGETEAEVLHTFTIDSWDITIEGFSEDFNALDYPFDDLLQAAMPQPFTNVGYTGVKEQVRLRVYSLDTEPDTPIALSIRELNGSTPGMDHSATERIRAFAREHPGIGYLGFCSRTPDDGEHLVGGGRECTSGLDEEDTAQTNE